MGNRKNFSAPTPRRKSDQLKVLFCDNHVLAVYKPAGVLSQGDHTGDPSMLELTKTWVKTTYSKPGNVYLGLVHRLDRPVSGVMVFARTSKGAARLSESFRVRNVSKTYLALVEGAVDAPGKLCTDLDGKECELTFSPIHTHRGTTLLRVSPRTGRKHQIRRQLSDYGHPIVGDLRYGAKIKMRHKRIALQAQELRIPHPIGGRLLHLQAPRPEFLPISTWPTV
jgi:23S rRNA pseudouridine1911/1915/1917 synthase